VRLEHLTHDHDCSAFSCGKRELDEWLARAALTAQRMGTSRVFVWLADEAGRVVGCFALAPHTVDRAEAPSSVAHGAPSQIPAILLGKLALDSSLQGQGFGGVLLAAALARAIDGMRHVGGRVVVADAIDDEARALYEHFGFLPVPGNPRRLVRKASDIAASLQLPWP
jgi:GNAT superfamily N-acetyltransferase